MRNVARIDVIIHLNIHTKLLNILHNLNKKYLSKKMENGTENGQSSFDDKLLEPLHYLTKIPGKKIRSKLIQV
jgi:hypothetical protein